MITILVIIGIIALIYLSMYNGLIRRKNAIDNAFSGMDVQLKKRYDLIPNLVATVKQYAKHEKETLTEIAGLRSQAMKPNLSNDQKVDLDNQISKSMRGIMMNIENYPDLKANENFMDLQHNLTEVESQIAAARRTYNAVVTDYNTAIEAWPGSMIARRLGYKRQKTFVISEEERQNVNVKDMFAN